MKITCVTLMLLMCLTHSHARCTDAPFLTVSYEGGAMALNGKHLVLSVCNSGDVEFDNPSRDGWERRKVVLSIDEKNRLLSFIDRDHVRKLHGHYSLGKLIVRDHWEVVHVEINRAEGKQEFSASDFYGLADEPSPPEAVAFLCRVETLRKGTDDWKPFSSLHCKNNADVRDDLVRAIRKRTPQQ